MANSRFCMYDVALHVSLRRWRIIPPRLFLSARCPRTVRGVQMFIITLMFGSLDNASTGMAEQEKKKNKKNNNSASSCSSLSTLLQWLRVEHQPHPPPPRRRPPTHSFPFPFRAPHPSSFDHQHAVQQRRRLLCPRQSPQQRFREQRERPYPPNRHQ